MKKLKMKNIVKFMLIGLKSILVGIVTNLIMLIPFALLLLLPLGFRVIGYVALFPIGLVIWGYLAKTWFKWN